ncbi:BA75_04134T0 [Komagataella pastoris]|uniref:BA75_04134T0 n=1 Tax=Komagataella pastoris TaxID=4922 RepID=A0A1B2JFS5_PICPA|nr:BA75_04134T0 [Komagataella pastoris]
MLENVNPGSRLKSTGSSQACTPNRSSRPHYAMPTLSSLRRSGQSATPQLVDGPLFSGQISCNLNTLFNNPLEYSELNKKKSRTTLKGSAKVSSPKRPSPASLASSEEDLFEDAARYLYHTTMDKLQNKENADFGQITPHNFRLPILQDYLPSSGSEDAWKQVEDMFDSDLQHVDEAVPNSSTFLEATKECKSVPLEKYIELVRSYESLRSSFVEKINRDKQLFHRFFSSEC